MSERALIACAGCGESIHAGSADVLVIGAELPEAALYAECCTPRCAYDYLREWMRRESEDFHDAELVTLAARDVTAAFDQMRGDPPQPLPDPCWEVLDNLTVALGEVRLVDEHGRDLPPAFDPPPQP